MPGRMARAPRVSALALSKAGQSGLIYLEAAEAKPLKSGVFSDREL